MRDTIEETKLNLFVLRRQVDKNVIYLYFIIKQKSPPVRDTIEQVSVGRALLIKLKLKPIDGGDDDVKRQNTKTLAKETTR